MPHRIAMIERASRNSARRHVPMLAIAGDSAVGKTTLTKGLVQALGSENISSFCTDDYHRYDRVERKTLPFTPLHPECNYLNIMEQHLQLLATGQPILKPIYNHHHGTLERPVLFEPKDFVVVEGLFPLWSKLSRACFDVTVFLDPPEDIRRKWKVQRDVAQRGYTEEQVIADLEKREPESSAYIRPQRANADIVMSFAKAHPNEGDDVPLSVSILLRPTIDHPAISDLLSTDTREAIHMKLMRDDDNKPVDVLHIHGHAPSSVASEIKEAIWSKLGIDQPLPASLGRISEEKRSEPLAIAQLYLLYHLIQASKS
ncbi:MAG: phosphoribulokinase [Actinomycetota bacterium]|nr:phosphoribulokinase [Actinomycetota bacterium]